MVPGARFGIAHGRLKEKELVKTIEDFSSYSHGRIRSMRKARLNPSDFGNTNGHMRMRFLHAKIDVLIATTIIENGLNLPNVNALIVADSTRLGLAETYQIRGAGNILGKEQSGNINRVGLNLYCQMLSEAIEKIKRA